MMNAIPEQQNQIHQLERLAAQRQMYAYAKRLQGVHFLVSVVFVVTLAYVAAFRPEAKLWSAAWSCVAVLIDVFLFTPWIKALKEQAARAQELFDCDVLQIPWNSCAAKRKPSAEVIGEWADGYRRNQQDEDFPGLRDWYAVTVGSLPIPLARLVCQRANLRWDGDQRRLYARWVTVILGLALAAIAATGFFGNWKARDIVLQLLAPSLPISVFLSRQRNDNLSHAEAVDCLRDHVERLWDEAMECKSTDAQLSSHSRNLQDQIFDRRSAGPLVPECVYNRLKTKNEALMYKGVEALVREVNQRLGDCPELQP